ncbi:MAG: preprotein translocase subunit SecE [bacterium]|nr:preprotein translocase subunit SecE [bacterium]
MNIFSKLTTFLKEVRLEVKKVDWPTRQETIRYTIIVIGVCVSVAVFLGSVDFVFKQFLNKIVL